MKLKRSQISEIKKFQTYYKCSTCGDTFTKKKKYRHHIKSHADFSNENDMHHEEKANIYQTMETALNDRAWSTNKDDTIYAQLETIYKCKICEEEFWKKKKYKMHLQTHEDNPDLEAIYNMEETNEHKQLQGYFVDSDNRVTHADDNVFQFEGECINVYKCSQCVATFSKQKKLKLHLLLTHPNATNAHSDKQASNIEEIEFDLNGSEDLFTCSVCTIVFESCEHLENHNCSGKKLFQCAICKKGLTSKWGLNMHYLTHSDTYQYQCNVCSRYFKHRYNLLQHSTIHTGEKLFKCDICDKSFRLLTLLRRHVARHEDKRPHHCNVCLKSFKTKDDFKNHQLTHDIDKRYKCDKCDLAFTKNSLMQVHARTHSGPKPYVCRICSALFSQRDQLDQHKAMLHKKMEANLYKCDKCDTVLKCWRALCAHSRTHSEKRPFKCSKCGAMFKYKPNLNTHSLYSKSCGSQFKKKQNSHVKCDMCGGLFATIDKLEVHILTHAEWPYKCDLCLKVFETLPNLADHRKNHTLYSCNVCGVDFLRYKTLTAHRLEHKPVKSFQCKSCKTAFITQQDLKCHSEIHKVKPFQCDLCTRNYLYEATLKWHYKSHFTGPRPYKCNWCSKKFRHIFYLDEHLRKEHAT